MEFGVEWGGIYFITMLFADWNLELSWEIVVCYCSVRYILKINKNGTLIFSTFFQHGRFIKTLLS